MRVLVVRLIGTDSAIKATHTCNAPPTPNWGVVSPDPFEPLPLLQMLRFPSRKAERFFHVACLIPPARSSAINERKSYNVTQSRPRGRTRPLISKGFLRLTVTSFPSLRHTLPRRARPPPTRIKREVLRNSTNLRLATAGRSVRCLRHLRAGKRLLFIGSNKAEDDCSWQILPEEEKPPAERTLSYFA